MKNPADKHTFAFFYPEVSTLSHSHASLIIEDSDLVHRLCRVVRIKLGDQCTLFDRAIHMMVEITAIHNNRITCAVKSVNPISRIAPAITVLLPWLKRDALEQAIVSAAELGVETIQLIRTNKVHAHTVSAKEYERLQRIMISGCEQAKQFAVPQLRESIAFEDALGMIADKKILFDVLATESTLDTLVAMRHDKPPHIAVLIGPEADLTMDEKAHAKKAGFITLSLGSMVLRSYKALTIGLGLIRACM